MARHPVSHFLPFSPRTTYLQAATYLLCICLFSISFLVFLNSSISFIITSRLRIHTHVGDLVGTLGFIDELVALVACPFWGILSDRIGVRWVAVAGYAIVGVSLLGMGRVGSWAETVVARVGFSVGGSATATMVTAILPVMTGGYGKFDGLVKGRGGGNNEVRTTGDEEDEDEETNVRHSMTPSLESEVTITPERYSRAQSPAYENPSSVSANGTNGSRTSTTGTNRSSSSPPRLAGLVGVFTGVGALVALALFLPLPAQFSKKSGISQAQAVSDSFYVVGSIALLVSLFCFFGLRNLSGEQGKGFSTVLNPSRSKASASSNDSPRSPQTQKFLPFHKLIGTAALLGLKDPDIALAYLGGFVARASSVAISLFIPLYINAFFISLGYCHAAPDESLQDPALKKECRAAYLLASELTGISQLIALLSAPLFGYLSSRWERGNLPLLCSAVFGIAGYVGFARLKTPEVKDVDGRGGTAGVIFVVALLGINQVGAIVCSLGLLGRGVLGGSGDDSTASQRAEGGEEASPLLSRSGETAELRAKDSGSREHLKGSIAGVYSLSGGAAILLLTKLGGYLFDSWTRGAPFYLMAIFNGVLLVVGLGIGVGREVLTRRR